MSPSSPGKIDSNPGIFRAAYPEAFHYKNPMDKRVKNLAQRIFSEIKNFFYQFFHKAVGFIVLPAQKPRLFSSKRIRERKEFLKTQFGGTEVNFQTADSVSINGMHFQGKNCQKSDRTVILFNGNSIRYESYGGDSLFFDIDAWQNEGWNVLVFNYRGVGDSKGRATRDGLILDGDAAFQYVKKQMNVPEEKILLHGHSLGAGVSSEVAVMHPQIHYCNDRSFSSLSKQVKVMFGNGIIGRNARKLLLYWGWEYNSRRNWHKIKGKKFAVYHENDTVIPAGAEFHKKLTHTHIKIKMCNDHKKFANDDSSHANHPTKNREALFVQKMRQRLEKLELGKVAHVRRYTTDEKVHYFATVNTI